MELALKLLLVGIAIAANNLAVSLELGTVAERRVWPRILLVFAVFEFFVPLVGVWIGQQAAQALADRAAWIGPACLFGLGALAVVSAVRGERQQRDLARYLTGWGGLVALSAGLSADNLLVGFGLGLGGVPPLALASVILVCSVGFAYAGLRIGRRAGRSSGRAAGLASGLILIVLGLTGWLGWH